jgi:NAD(P)H-dependent flavin oxidoreductase YrpB (nitropropane dioxygenase family)
VSGAAEPGSGPGRVSAWRVAAAVAVLGGLGWIGALVLPVYLRNFELEKFLHESRPASEEALRQSILAKGHSLGLDIAPDHLQIRHGAGAADVRYVVRVSLPLYSVDLHFASTLSTGFQ